MSLTIKEGKTANATLSVEKVKTTKKNQERRKESHEIEILDCEFKPRKGDTAFNTVDAIASDPAVGMALLHEALEENDFSLLMFAIGKIAEAKNRAEMARKVGMSRPALYTALSAKGNPTIGNFMKILSEVGLKMALIPT